ncbi:MAG: hypothetical protein ACRDZ4_05595, partial [Egibacteraceae bacterium]
MVVSEKETPTPRASPYVIVLTAEERASLEAAARRYTSPYRDVLRARIVLYAAAGLRNDEIAARLDTPARSSPKDANASTSNAWPGWPMFPGADSRRVFPQRRQRRSKRWPVSCPRPAAPRWHAPTWPAPQPTRTSSRRSR